MFCAVLLDIVEEESDGGIAAAGSRLIEWRFIDGRLGCCVAEAFAGWKGCCSTACCVSCGVWSRMLEVVLGMSSSIWVNPVSLLPVVDILAFLA